MFDTLGDVIKNDYENRTRIFLPRRTYTIVRVDGRSFSKYTSNLDKPFDFTFHNEMDQVGIALCKGLAGAALAYVQSDEITVVLTDFYSEQTEALFDGNLQKICSISAAIATEAFNRLQWKKVSDKEPKVAHFDARVFTIPDINYVIKCLYWRQKDATRNSISMAARSVFSHNELDGKSTSEMQAMMLTKDINWNDYPVGAKRGRLIVKRQKERDAVFVINGIERTERVMRGVWEVEEPAIFTQNPETLYELLPKHPNIIDKTIEGEQ